MAVRRGAGFVAQLRRQPWLPAALAGVFTLALLARLLPVLHGGGLLGIDTYDDGVHYAAALALVNDRLPYRDFLLLHPPGVVLALTPFAAFGSATHDGWGFAAGRVAWMVMGSATAALVVLALRRVGWFGAVVGGIGYAIYPPAVHAERTTMLEGLTGFLLALALVLLGTTRLRIRHPWWIYLGGGALLGLATGVKIWGVVVVAVVVGWAALAHGLGKALRVGLGALLGVTVVCLPFFLGAPTEMWRMVVRDQLARPENGVATMTRLAAIVGLPPGQLADSRVVVAAVIVLVTFLVLAVGSTNKLPPVLVLAMGTVVLLSPSFYFHYPACLAVPLFVSIGVAVAVMRGWTATLGRWAPRIVVAATALVLIVVAAPLSQQRNGVRLPVAILAPAVVDRPGCVTADDPAILVAFDVFSRNLRRGCRVMVDLTGHSYDLTPGLAVPRMRNPAFQQFALDYMSSGELTAPWRLRAGWGYSTSTVRELQRWPVLVGTGAYVLRTPEPTYDAGK